MNPSYEQWSERQTEMAFKEREEERRERFREKPSLPIYSCSCGWVGNIDQVELDRGHYPHCPKCYNYVEGK